VTALDWIKAAGLVLGGFAVGAVLGVLLLYVVLVATYTPPV
jgi:hypothetical protein